MDIEEQFVELEDIVYQTKIENIVNELKCLVLEQIEKMKCCENCKHSKQDLCNGGVYDLYCNILDCEDKSKWKLKESE